MWAEIFIISFLLCILGALLFIPAVFCFQHVKDNKEQLKDNKEQLKDNKKQLSKRDIVIAAREEAAKTMNGVVVQDASRNWAIMPKKEWMGMRRRNYDASWATLDENERAIKLKAREAIAAAMKGVMVQDGSGYWGVVEKFDWMVMKNYD
jgi:hypothetical protein